jgi:hypothetical protein
MPKEITVEVAPGKTVSALDLEFKPKSEQWNEYELENGGLLRVRVIISDIALTNEKNPAGDPLVITKANVLVTYKGPTKTETEAAGKNAH